MAEAADLTQSQGEQRGRDRGDDVEFKVYVMSNEPFWKRFGRLMWYGISLPGPPPVPRSNIYEAPKQVRKQLSKEEAGKAAS